MDNILKVQEIVDEFMSKGFGNAYQVEYTPLSETEIKIDISGHNVSNLIGQHGKTLLSLQHLIRQIYINRTQDFNENLKIIIDIDHYKEKRVDRIKQLAQNAVEKCRSLGKEVSLPSMTPFERHVVHSYIQENHPDIATSSIGEEPNRRVTLRLA